MADKIELEKNVVKELRNKTILVTGGAGFIGSPLVSQLHTQHELIVLATF